MVDKDFFEGISTLSNSSADSMKHPSGDEALILKIEIENRVEELIVREGEPAKIAVNKFCARHSLPSEIELALLKKVVENLQPIKVQALSVEPKPRFIKKGNFIKKEIPRGRSVLSNTNRSLASPDKRKNEETKSYVQSPVIRNKSRSINPLNNSTQSINRKPRQQSNKLIQQYVPIKNSNFKSILKEKLHCGKIFNSFSSSRDCETKKEEPQPNFKKLFSVEQSQTILNRIKYLRIKKIFDTIDTEKIGFLNRKNIEEFRGEVQVMKILRPVLEDIMNKRLSVNLSEFEEKVDMLLMKLSSNERMALLDVKST